jgi:glycosyltransferase involved in cell wall biosynthesis
MKDMIKNGHNVIAMAPETGYERELESAGIGFFPLPLKRAGLNPIEDLRLLFHLRRLFVRLRPDAVFVYAVKPVIYGSIAARLAGTGGIYAMITGLGYAFTGESLFQRLLRNLMKPLYALALKNCQKVFFQNPDDLEVFLKLKMVDENKAVLVNGSGVNLQDFEYAAPVTSPFSFLLIARLIRDKGIMEFAEAARLLKKKHPGVLFRLLGPHDPNPTAISAAEIKAWTREGIIEYLGETGDVRPYIAQASVYVLPSYREGTPRSVLEAMAMGRPVITTDAPGCRETVREGVNGFLVPVKDAAALAGAMERFILEPGLVERMGLESRKIAEEKYDVRKVNRIMLEAMGLEGL